MNLYTIVTSIGVVSILSAFLYIGRKLQVLDDLQKTSHKIKVNIKVIGDHLTRFDVQFNPKELQSFSPYKLTSEGNQLIQTIGFDDVFRTHKQDFFDVITGEEPKLKYDVELAAIKSIVALADQDYMQFLKVFFYNNPKRNIQNVAPTLGVYLRDKYLAEHPEITE